MDYDAEDRREEREATQAPGQDAGNFPQFQLVLRATDGDHVLGASDTVNDLVEQAKIWLNATDAGVSIAGMLKSEPSAFTASQVYQEWDKTINGADAKGNPPAHTRST